MSYQFDKWTDEELVGNYREMQHLPIDVSSSKGIGDLALFHGLVREMARRFVILVEANEEPEELNRVQNILNQEYVSKEDIDEAIAEIMRSDIPLNYVDECERAAFADGQGDALSKLKELLWRSADEDE